MKERRSRGKRDSKALAIRADVGQQTEVEAALAEVADAAGEVDIYCSNAGIVATGGLETTADDWQQNWQVNTMAHVYAAQVLIPKMAERGSGFFAITASAAGLLTEMSSLSYSVVKHGAVAVGEWLSLTHGSGALCCRRAAEYQCYARRVCARPCFPPMPK